MKIRFRKSIKIVPGVKVNLSKSGVSTSVGGRGATVNFSKRGTRVTAGIPGTGLSASKLYPKSPKPYQDRPTGKDEWIVPLIVLAIIFGFIAYFSDKLRPLAIAICIGSAIALYFLTKKPKPLAIPEDNTSQPVADKPKPITTTWQERVAEIENARPEPQEPISFFNNKVDSVDTTAKSIMTAPHLQATVDGSPTYDYSDRKNDLSAMIACTEAEIENYWKQPSGRRLCAAPFYFERAAILCRKAKLYADEVRVCEAWIAIIEDYSSQNNGLAAKVHLGARSKGILNRLTKARELLKKQQEQ